MKIYLLNAYLLIKNNIFSPIAINMRRLRSGICGIHSLSFGLLLLLLNNSYAKGQELLWKAGFNGFFDNREYFNAYVEPQTMFGSHMFAYAGFSLNESQAIYGGLDFLYEFGAKVNRESVKPILFFNFSKEYIDLRMGAFPRKYLIELPLFLQSDTISYYRPNLEGIYLNLRRSWGLHNVWLDWTSRQTDIDREIFQLGGSGEAKYEHFFYGHDFIMTHFAGPAIDIPGDHIRDNGGLFARIGINLSDFFFDSLSISTGYCFSYDRLRNVYDLRFSHGSLTQLYIELYGFAIRTSHYFGEGQVQLTGDGLYGAPSYQRFDLDWLIFRRKNVKGRIELSLHLVEDVLDFSQSFTIYADLGNERKSLTYR